MNEGIMHQPIKGGDDPLLIHRIGRRVEGEVDLNCAVGGAQVPRPDMQPSYQAKRAGVAEDVVPPRRSVGLLGDASGLGCELAPGGSGSAKVSPPFVRQQLGESWEVVGISVDIPDDEGGSRTPQAEITDDGLQDRVSSSCLGSIAMGPSVAIHVVPVAHLGSLALAMRQKLRAPQFNVLGKLWASGIKRQAGVGGEANGSNASAGLTAVGVRAGVVQLAPMHRTELEGKSAHGSLGGAVLLKERDISTPLSQPFSIRGEVGDVLSLDDGEARTRNRRWYGFRDRLDERLSFPLHR